MLAGEHQLEQRRVGGREPDVRRRGRSQPRLEFVAGAVGGGAQFGAEALESGLGERVEQRLAVGEVAARRAVADADLPRELPQRQLFDAALADGPLGRGQQRGAEVAVVVGPLGRRLRAVGRHPSRLANDVVVDIIVVIVYIVGHDYFLHTDIPDMTGRTVIITGANSGIGRAAAQALAAKGARVVLAVRDTDKGHAAAAPMTGDDRGSPARPREPRLDPRVRRRLGRRDRPADQQRRGDGPAQAATADGFELQFGTNHLGHFALTNLLLEHVTGRVVTVSSTGHRIGAIDFDDLHWERKPYKAWRAYGQSKLANLLFTAELQRRLIEVGSASGDRRASRLRRDEPPVPFRNRAMDTFNAVANRLLAQDEDGGALPTLYAAVADVPGNSFAGPAASWSGAAEPSWSSGPPPPRTRTSPAACGMSPSSSPASAFP